MIPPAQIAPQALALLNYFPQPNLTGSSAVNDYNYHLLTTAAIEYHAGRSALYAQRWARMRRCLAADAACGGGGRRSQQNQGLRQSINFNYNWTHSASDAVNFVPQLGGKSASDSNSRAGRLYRRLSQGDQHLQT